MLERFHAHLHDVWRRLSLSIPSGWVTDVGGLTCIATGSTSPSFNLALSGGPSPDPGSALDEAAALYRAAQLRWLLKLQPKLDGDLIAQAERRGYGLDEEPVYRIALGSITPVTTPRQRAPLSIEVAGPDTIEDAVRCVAEAFEADADDVQRELGPNLLRIPTFTVLIGYVAGEPVATSLLATTSDVRLAGVYSVATRPSHRGRGFGTALTRAALLEARASGYDTAVLEPSPMGAPMYRRMGFEPFASYLEAVG
jgi:ribosomal protein S18 acetylase RimI-like enzyme